MNLSFKSLLALKLSIFCRSPSIVLKVRPTGWPVWIRIVPPQRLLRPILPILIERGILFDVPFNKSPPLIPPLLHPALTIVTSLVEIFFFNHFTKMRIVKPVFLTLNHPVSRLSTLEHHEGSFPLRALRERVNCVIAELRAGNIAHALWK